eukprot:1621978-Rhodomonas_salina.1
MISSVYFYYRPGTIGILRRGIVTTGGQSRQGQLDDFVCPAVFSPVVSFFEAAEPAPGASGPQAAVEIPDGGTMYSEHHCSGSPIEFTYCHWVQHRACLPQARKLPPTGPIQAFKIPQYSDCAG